MLLVHTTKAELKFRLRLLTLMELTKCLSVNTPLRPYHQLIASDSISVLFNLGSYSEPFYFIP